jgi:hypothetical protein
VIHMGNDCYISNILHVKLKKLVFLKIICKGRHYLPVNSIKYYRESRNNVRLFVAVVGAAA